MGVLRSSQVPMTGHEGPRGATRARGHSVTCALHVQSDRGHRHHVRHKWGTLCDKLLKERLAITVTQASASLACLHRLQHRGRKGRKAR